MRHMIIGAIKLVVLGCFLYIIFIILYHFYSARLSSSDAMEEYAKNQLNHQFQVLSNKKYGGGVLVLAPSPNDCLPNITPCTSITTIPFSEESGLNDIRDNPEQFRLVLEDGYPKRSEKYVWVFRWKCCGEKEMATGQVTISNNSLVQLEGTTISGEEIAFWIE